MLIYDIIDDKGDIVQIDKVQQAIERVKFAYEVSVKKGLGDLYVAFSGGKDSIVLADIVKRANVPYSLNYNITTVDPPELIYFMRKNYPKLIWNKPPINEATGKRFNMFSLIIYKKMPPTRIIRYCCSVLKERGGQGKVCLTGVRWAESTQRAKRKPYEVVTQKYSERMLFNDNFDDRQSFEHCITKGKLVSNPIIDWTDSDIWDYIKIHDLPYCELYDKGYKRLGCIGCPMSDNAKELEDYPRFKKLYLLAFDKMIKKPDYTKSWHTAEDVMSWWIRDNNEAEYPLLAMIDLEELV